MFNDKNYNLTSFPDSKLIEKTSCMNLNEKTRLELLQKHGLLERGLGKLDVLPHEIILKDSYSFSAKPFAFPERLRKATEEEIKRQLSEGIIRPSCSEFASRAFPVEKRNGQIRLVVDYRTLNSKTVKLAYPFPSLRDSFLDLRGSTIFSRIDLHQGYYQIPLAEKSIHLTSFVVPNGQFEFLRLPFGLTNAPRSFQKTMTDMFKNMAFVKMFLDNILIFSKNTKEHINHLNIVLETLSRKGAPLIYQNRHSLNLRLST